MAEIGNVARKKALTGEQVRFIRASVNAPLRQLHPSPVPVDRAAEMALQLRHPMSAKPTLGEMLLGIEGLAQLRLALDGDD